MQTRRPAPTAQRLTVGDCAEAMADSVCSVTVPAGLAEGQTFAVQTPDGRMLNVTVPAGLSAGDQMSVEAPPVVAAVVVQGAAFVADSEADDGGGDVPVVNATVVSGLNYFPAEFTVAVPITGTSLPPDFNLTQLPREGAEAFVPVDHAPPPSTAVFERFENGRVDTGVLSYDERLQTSVHELTRFFQTHNTKPQMKLHVKGWHTIRSRSGKHTNTQTVIDFSYTFDLTELVAPFGYMQAKPNAMGEPRTLPQVLDEYIASTNSLKEINMHKHIEGFDTNEVIRAFASHIRNKLGFRQSITVSFTYPNSTVKVVTPTAIAKCAQCSRNNECVACLCLMTCVCIIWYPLLHMLGDKRDDIFSNFMATTNATTWLQGNLHRLHCQRDKGRPLGGGTAWDVTRQGHAPPPTFPAMRPVVASGWGAATPSAPVVKVPLDTNGDGQIDSYGSDTTGDGAIDTVVPVEMVMVR